MTHPSSPSIVLRRRTGGAFALLRAFLEAATRALRIRWSAFRARRSEARALRAVCALDAHMLRDIGAPDELIARATADSRSYPRPEILFQLAFAVVAIAAMGTAAAVFAAPSASREATGNAQPGRPLVAVFTGEFVDGAPVYRFPAIVVTGSRKAEPAKNEQPLAECQPAKAINAREPA